MKEAYQTVGFVSRVLRINEVITRVALGPENVCVPIAPHLNLVAEDRLFQPNDLEHVDSNQ